MGSFASFLIQERQPIIITHIHIGYFLCRLITEILKHPTVIIIGETGSGKTTQIPQFMHEVRLDRDGLIGVTQVSMHICIFKS